MLLNSLMLVSYILFVLLLYDLVTGYDNRLAIQTKEYDNLLKKYESAQRSLEYMTRVSVKKEKVFGENGNAISQHYLELPDLGVSPVVAPFSQIKSVNGVAYRVFFNWIWTFENWQMFQKGKYWVRYTDKQGKRTKVYKAWVDEPLKNDVRLDTIEISYDDEQDRFRANSELPCKWEYLGYELA